MPISYFLAKIEIIISNKKKIMALTIKPNFIILLVFVNPLYKLR